MANCNLNAAPVGAAIFDEPVSYLDLKAWIAEQEALPQPEPLTDIQKKAILDLKKSIVKTKQSFHLDHADWVSLLMRYRDAHAAEGCTVEFNDNHQNQVGKVGFMCFVSLSVTRDWEPILFPSKENGILVDDATGAPYVPHFTKKKDAKRYAAKCAIEWLMYQRYMPSDCQNVTFKAKSKPGNPQNGQSKQPPGVPVVVPLVITPQTTPTASVNTNGIVNGNGAVSAPVSIPSTPSSPANGESDSNDGSDGASLDPDAVSNSANSLAPYLAKPPPAPRRRKGTDNILDIDVHDDSISVHQRLAEMAKRLGMQVPHIIVEPIPDAQNMFRGQANFPIEAGQVPEHVGRVDSGFMGPATKEMVAEKVLEYLFEVERVRIAEFDSIIADEESH
ncbi:unnamed protein product [Sordaria macrospora k-hell]|uniref:WGS project CABT00000000 data, contig 2.1 n=2 Tax=Sordaria macrospora TaxID=5147 RepID=F7VK32_SORMK|nr:uncharacterized protein SMAC_00075 [Sordaria macrospora k-hell]KAH7632181.1 hypothetical protein B0T09DRAFT_260484 [Sordaria sp. MPI-SDFR-AT-0083]CCC05859.1 unnamed protein product [Sordaria macrospora k-hell]